MALPPPLRLLLAVGISVAITLGLVRLLHSRIIAQQAKDDLEKQRREQVLAQAEAAGEDPPDLPPLPPDQKDLAGRALGLTATAFVFLLAFTLGSFWGETKDARSATEAEAADWVKSVALVRTIPADQGQAQIAQALEDYRRSVQEVQWPLMEQADAAAAYRAAVVSDVRLTSALVEAERAGASTSPEWSLLKSAVGDMIDQGRQRIESVPNATDPGVLILIGILAVANVALAAVFQPARLQPSLFLLGVMAALASLMMFVVVEASNPYIGGGKVVLPVMEITQP